MKKYLLFHIVGYDTKINDIDFTNKVVVRLIDKDCDSALERAKKLITRALWFVAEIVEFKED
jgi:hypothetical protein